MSSIRYYEQHAPRLADKHESLPCQDVHAGLFDMLPPSGATVLDVGAGSGRDTAWFAANNPIFDGTRRRQIRTPSPLQIDEAFLWSLGDFRVPLEI